MLAVPDLLQDPFLLDLLLELAHGGFEGFTLADLDFRQCNQLLSRLNDFLSTLIYHPLTGMSTKNGLKTRGRFSKSGEPSPHIPGVGVREYVFN